MLFYTSLEELETQIKGALASGEWVNIARAGHARVLQSNYSWRGQMELAHKKIERNA